MARMKPAPQLRTVANEPSPRSAVIASVPTLKPMKNPHSGSRSRKNRNPAKQNAAPMMIARIPIRNVIRVPPPRVGMRP